MKETISIDIIERNGIFISLCFYRTNSNANSTVHKMELQIVRWISIDRITRESKFKGLDVLYFLVKSGMVFSSHNIVIGTVSVFKSL